MIINYEQVLRNRIQIGNIIKTILPFLICLFIIIGCSMAKNKQISNSIIIQRTEPKHLIDTKEEECFNAEGGFTTLGMGACINTALEEWDKELNDDYNILMGNLDKDGQEKLRLSQRKWIEYKDNEIAFARKFYNRQGTAWGIIYISRELEIIRNRAMELKNYLKN
jgi:uncharacterized protein YecT (DUF1311 family)